MSSAPVDPPPPKPDVEQLFAYARTVETAAAFAGTFAGCMVGLPIVGLLLAALTCNGSLAAVAIPFLAFWVGDLEFSHGPNHRWAFNGEGYRWIPVVVWGVTWAGFSWAARRLPTTRATVAAAVGVIAVVIVGMHATLRLLGVRYYFPNL